MVLGIGSELGDQLDAEGLTEQFVERLRDVAFVAKHLSEQVMKQPWNRLPVIDIARCKQDIKQLTPVVDDQVQFEPEKPASRNLSSTCQAGKHLVRGDTLVETHVQGS